MKKNFHQSLVIWEWIQCLHDIVLVPIDRVVVEICSWVEPKVDPLLSVTNTMGVHIGLKYVRLSSNVSQELKVELIVSGTIGGQLH
jgi:hypothetical protein